MIAARQFIAWNTVNYAARPVGDCRTSSRRLEGFVPEGLNDRSQAIYCLVFVQKKDPSRRDGVIGSDGRATIRTINQPG
jgi:hypothetical protein